MLKTEDISWMNDDSWDCIACQKEFDKFSEQEFGIIKYYVAGHTICDKCYEEHGKEIALYNEREKRI